MKALGRLAVILALGAVPGSVRAGGPVVVELFTAQGCAPCKDANHLVARVADRPGVIALTWPVDYWDYLGWKDTFAQPAYTLRQKAYAHRLGPRDVYTPQVVVNGAGQASGDDDAAVERLIDKSGHGHRRLPKIRWAAHGRLIIGRGVTPTHAAADVWLVRYDPREQDVTVTAGDNRGATVIQKNVVRQIVRLGAWTGRPGTFKLPPASEPGLGAAVIVQVARGGVILAAADAKARKS